MLRRKINETLLAWKRSPDRKPLIVKGCRQCGKTFSVLQFAKENYEHVVYLNFLPGRQLPRNLFRLARRGPTRHDDVRATGS